MADYATWEDVQARWRSLTQPEQDKATTYLGDASVLLRRNVPDLDERIATDNAAAIAAGTAVNGEGDLARAARAKVAGVVKRYMENPQGAKQLQRTIGPRTLGMTLPDGQATGVFFTEDELRELQPSSGVEGGGLVFGVAFAGYRPGWGPPSRHHHSGWWPTG
jgi:hypothetical protein